MAGNLGRRLVSFRGAPLDHRARPWGRFEVSQIRSLDVFYFTFTSLLLHFFEFAFRVLVRRRPRLDAAGQVNLALRVLAKRRPRLQDWTPLSKSSSLSGSLSTGGQDWTPLDKSISLWWAALQFELYLASGFDFSKPLAK